MTEALQRSWRDVRHYTWWITEDGEWSEVYVCRHCGARYGSITRCPAPGPCRSCGAFHGPAFAWLTAAGVTVRRSYWTRKFGFIPWPVSYRYIELKHEYEERIAKH